MSSVLSTVHMKENQVQVNGIAKKHGGLQSLTVDDMEPTLETYSLHLPVRKPTDVDVLNLPIKSLFTSDNPWDPQSLNDN